MTKQEIQELKASLSIREVIGRYTKLNPRRPSVDGALPVPRRPTSFPFRQ